MTKKQEALNKAKESGKKMIEGGKELGTGSAQVIGGTTGALGYALLSGGEKVASKISESRENDEGISLEEKERRKIATNEYNDRAKKHIVEAGKMGKKAVKGAGKALKGGAKAVGHTVKAGYHLIDAGDKAIGEQIEKKQTEKGKKSGKIGRFFRDNMMKLALFLSLSGVGGYKATEIAKDRHKNNQEVVIKDKDGYEVSFEEKEYFKNSDFFNKEFKTTIDETYKDKGIILIRDAGMTFYIVQNGENSKEKIREKLSAIPEFSYLNDPVYTDKIKGFNVPDASLKEGLYIPIPVKVEDRKIDMEEFREYSRIALQQMKDDPHYGEKTKKLIKQIGEEQIINTMIAFARCETAMDQQTFLDPIGTAELHRWEHRYQSFSFSYYHILMEKNADKKTPGPGLKARQNLGLTEGQCYHPINAGKLFLGYCFEKVKSNPTYFFEINNLEEAKTKGGTYNGDPTYGKKLRDNIQYISKR